MAQEQQDNLRSDLWPTMNLDELQNQQVLMVTRLTAITNLANSRGGGTPGVLSLLAALQHGQQTLQQIIDTKIANGER